MSQVPQQIDQYKIIEMVGEGGLGKVYKALDTQSNQIVALKVLHSHYGNDQRFLGVFHRELLMHRTLNHASLVPILDNHFKPPMCYIVSRFIDGWPLRGFTRHFGRLPPLVALSLTVQISAGLDALHLRDLVHGDLSAANILVEKSGRAFLTDFSLTSDTTALRQRDHIFGTPGYYSPEHLSKSPVTPASDVYVIGLLVYEMITGTKLIPPLDGGKQGQTILNLMASASFRSLKITHEALSQDILQLMRGMLHPLMIRRIENGEKLGRAVDALLKKYAIRNPQSAVLQVLQDGLLPTQFKMSTKQNIYLGHAPYSIDDLALLAPQRNGA